MTARRADPPPAIWVGAAALVQHVCCALHGRRVEIVEPWSATAGGIDLGPMWVCRAASGFEVALPADWLRPLAQGLKGEMAGS